MGKKKGDKGKKEKSEDGLPPPPNLDNYREGAREALLTFKIQGKEDSILQYEEEAENFKDRNYRQKEKNYELSTVQSGYRKAMLEQAMQYENNQASREEVAQEMVEEATWEKLQLAKDTQMELQGLEERIVAVGEQLEMKRKELEKWQKYKDSTVHAEEDYITEMKDQMQQMIDKEVELQSEHDSKLVVVKRDIDAKWQWKMEREKEAASERLLQSLDRDGRAEMTDNVWLKREIEVVREMVSELRLEVDQLELRNLHLLEGMQREQLQDLEISIGLLQASTGQSRPPHTAATSDECARGTPSLPSLVDIGKNINTRSVGGQLGQIERQMLNIKGQIAPLVLPPETTHLPPLTQQKYSLLPSKGTWPITAEMLHSIT